MENLKFGVYAGLLLAIVAVAGGFTGFLLGLVLATVGAIVGAHRDGLLDLRELLGSATRGRRGQR